MLKRAVLGLAGLTALAGCGGPALPPGVYAVPMAEAFALLRDADLTDFRNNRQCGVPFKLTPQARGTDEIEWRVISSGREMLWFRAKLTPVSATETRVAIEVEKRANGTELYAGETVTPRPVVVQPLRPAIEEMVAAVLQRRPFDNERAPTNQDESACGMQRGMLEEGYKLTVNDDPTKTPPRLSSED